MENLTQKELLAERLKVLKNDVTTQDRKLLAQKPGFSKTLVSRYENGKVYDNDKAVQMIRFLERRINKRNAVLVN